MRFYAKLLTGDLERLGSIQANAIAQIIAHHRGADPNLVAEEATAAGGFSMKHEWVEFMWCGDEGIQRQKELADFFETAPQPPSARAYREFYNSQRDCWIEGDEVPQPINSIESQLHLILSDPKFILYRKVFARFGFGLRIEAVLISQIYPLQDYLGEDGNPEVRIRKGRKSGKGTKRYLSLRRFQKALGLAPSMESSGDIARSKVVSGSALCRKSIWQWVFSRIEPKLARPKNELCKFLGECLDAEKAAGKPVKLVRSRISAKAVKLLFKELVRELKTC